MLFVISCGQNSGKRFEMEHDTAVLRTSYLQTVRSINRRICEPVYRKLNTLETAEHTINKLYVLKLWTYMRGRTPVWRREVVKKKGGQGRWDGREG